MDTVQKVINLEEAIELYVESMKADKKSQNTIIKYRTTLHHLMKYAKEQKGTTKINEKDLKTLIHEYIIKSNNYTNTLNKKVEYKTSSSNNRRSSLRSFVKKMYVLDKITEDFSSSIEILKMETGGKKRVLSREEIEKVSKLLNKEIKESEKEQMYLKIRNKYMFWFFVLTGVRISEIVNLKKEDIDMLHNEILIRKSKGKKTRIIDMLSDLKLLLYEYEAGLKELENKGYKIDSPYLFTKYTKPDKPMNPKTAYLVIIDIMKRAGINSEEEKEGNISPHNLRHTYVSYGIDKNVNPAYLARQVGHASPDVLYRVYTHEIDQKQREAEKAKMEEAFMTIVK